MSPRSTAVAARLYSESFCRHISAARRKVAAMFLALAQVIPIDEQRAPYLPADPAPCISLMRAMPPKIQGARTMCDGCRMLHPTERSHRNPLHDIPGDPLLPAIIEPG